MGIQAIELFHQVPANLLDRWIYVCVLNACSHSGLIDEARQILGKIPAEKKTEKVYTTMVDTHLPLGLSSIGKAFCSGRCTQSDIPFRRGTSIDRRIRTNSSSLLSDVQ